MNALAASTVVDDTNNGLAIVVDGKTSQGLTLAAGTYTPTALQAVAAAINAAPELAGASVNVAVVGNKLSITSTRYGLASEVAVSSGTALPALGFLGGESAQGKDVAGSFLVNGVTETALGQGQFLTGDQANANTAALEVRVTLTPAQVGVGIQVPVSVSNGLAAQVNNLLNGLSDPVSGRFKQVDDDYQTSLAKLKEQEAQQNTYIQTRTAQLQAQFAAMEQTLNQLQVATNAINALSQNLTSSSNSKSGSGSSTA